MTLLLLLLSSLLPFLIHPHCHSSSLSHPSSSSSFHSFSSPAQQQSLTPRFSPHRMPPQLFQERATTEHPAKAQPSPSPPRGTSTCTTDQNEPVGPQQRRTMTTHPSITINGSSTPRPIRRHEQTITSTMSEQEENQRNFRFPAPTGSTPKLRIAVIGSGLAGLTAAHLLSSLHRENEEGDRAIDVHLFEKAHKIGMDAASLSVSCPCHECAQSSGRKDVCDPYHEHVEGRMDVPMRSFFPEYYPNLVRLYRSIGVDFHDADNTLSCFDVNIDSKRSNRIHDHDDRPFIQVQEPYLSSRSYKIRSQTINLPDLPPFSILNPFPFGRRVLGYCRIAIDYLRMLLVSKEFLAKGRIVDIGKHPIEWGNGRMITLREFLDAGGYSHEFSAFFVPLFASVCTCSFERMMEYPACVVLEYVARCMPFGRMQFISSGVQDVTEKLSRNVGTIHYNTKVEQVVRNEDEDVDDGIVLIDSYGVHRTFDHVVFATQANQAAVVLAGLPDENQSLPKPFIGSPEAGYDRSSYGRKEEHDHTNSEIPSIERSLLDSIKPNHPFYKQVRTLVKFPYERTRVVCHTDTSFLPKNPAHWRLLNIAKSTKADVLASPLNKISKELEQEMELRSRKAKTPRSSIFSLRSPSSLSNSSRNKLIHRKSSHSMLRTHFAPLSSSSSSSTPTLTSSGTVSSASTAGSTGSNSTMASQSHNSAMATHIMNSSSSQLGSTTKFLQTTNPIYPPRPDTVISSAWFERAVVNPNSVKAVDELQWLMEQQTERWVNQNDATAAEEQEKEQEQEQASPRSASPSGSVSSSSTSASASMSVSDRVWFVGSYAYPGIPLLEGCVASALQVTARIMAVESSFQLIPPEGSIMTRDQHREWTASNINNKNQKNDKRSRTSVSATYLQNAWKDTLDKHDKESPRQEIGCHSRAQSIRSSNLYYAEVAWMLLLYLAAIAKWWFVIVVESFGGDGSRWALA